MSKSGIYAIVNITNDKYYIGSAINFSARWTQHKSKLNLNIQPNKYLQAAWNKYGADCFIFVVLEYVYDRSKLLEREQYWIDFTRCCDREIGYNLFAIAGSPLGYKWTPERKLKQSAFMKDFRHTEEVKIKMRGRIKTTESLMKFRITRLGHEVTETTKLKISKGNKGKTRNRRYDKYPHELASKCKCEVCLKIRSEELKAWRYKRNSADFIMVDTNVY